MYLLIGQVIHKSVDKSLPMANIAILLRRLGVLMSEILKGKDQMSCQPRGCQHSCLQRHKTNQDVAFPTGQKLILLYRIARIRYAKIAV